jgi:UDP-N-acetylglucosamine acyltransferase
VHAGTAQDRGDTAIGNGNLFLAYTHVAHDCVVGNNTTFSNNAQIAGHVHIGDWAVLGAFAGVHQFCRVGAHAMLAAFAVVLQDVPPYVTVQGIPPSRTARTTKGCAGAVSRRRTSCRCAARTRRSIAKGSRSTRRARSSLPTLVVAGVAPLAAFLAETAGASCGER